MKSVGDPIEIPAEVAAYESEYRLPTLLGSPRQIDWARLIRHEFLTELLPKVIDATTSMAKEDARAFYDCLDRLRNNRDGKHWIEVVRHCRGKAVAYVLSLPAAEAAERERQRREEVAQEEERRQEEEEKRRKAEKSIDSRRLNKLADEFEDQHDLPDLVSPAHSRPQEGFGRRCRYQVLTKLMPMELDRVLPMIKTVTEPGPWIGAFLKNWTVEVMLQKHQGSASSTSPSIGNVGGSPPRDS